MVPTWIATCACGWVSAAETTEELMLLLDTHRTHASPGQLHTVTIKASSSSLISRHFVTGLRGDARPVPAALDWGADAPLP